MLRAPIRDDTFGVMRWDEKVDWWFGPVEFTPGHHVALAITPGGSLTGPVLRRARITLERVRAHEAEFRRSAALRIADAFNATVPERPLNAMDFAERLRLEEMTVYDDGSADLLFDEGGALAGHAVVVALDRRGVPCEVELAV